MAIVCNGNFNKNHMGAAQLDMLKRVVLDVAKYYGLTAEQVKGHREVGDSDCPGRYFPLDEVREYVRNNLNNNTPIMPTIDFGIRAVSSSSPSFDFIVDILSSTIPVDNVEVVIYPKGKSNKKKTFALVQNINNSLHYAKRINLEKEFNTKGTFVVRAGINGTTYKDFKYVQMG